MALPAKIKGHFRLFLLIVVLVLTIIAGAISAQEMRSEYKGKGLQVTVLLYSGRPNPMFVLDDSDSIGTVKKFFGKSKTVETFKKETVVPSILGYNGIIVENIGRTIEQFPESLIIYKGMIEVKDGRKSFQNDEDNEIENFLLNKAIEKKVIDEGTFQKIKAVK